jgi:Glycosyl transferase family 2
MIAIAICTHNPDERLLARTLAAVASQQIPPGTGIECVIVDNNSAAPVAMLPSVKGFLRQCSWARVVVEPKQGLSYARIAAIDHTTAPIVMFVDDDNEPEPDYIATALRILENSCIGVIGPGKVVVDFIDPVDGWFAVRFRHHFQEKDYSGLAYGCVGAAWTDYYPPGSCMVVRREVLLAYRSGFLAGQLSASDRAGASLSSGGDTQIVWEAVKMGMAAGISSELRIKHMIPAKRSTLPYMKRLCFGTSSSYLPALVGSFPSEKSKLSSPPSDGRIVMTIIEIVVRHVVRMKLKLLPIDLATYLGSTVGLVRASGSKRKWLDRSIQFLGVE